MNFSTEILTAAYSKVISGELAIVEVESKKRARYLIGQAQRRLHKYEGFLDKNKFTLLLKNGGMLIIRPPGEKYAGDLSFVRNQIVKYKELLAIDPAK